MRLAFTPGEPAGIGPDLAVSLAQDPPAVPLIVIADPEMLRQRALGRRLPLTVRTLAPGQAPGPGVPGELSVLPMRVAAPVVAGQLCTANAAYVLDCLRAALRACQQGAAGMVTGPVHKGVINDAGTPFRGHTEWLAAETGCDFPVMMLATPELRVALATTHLPLSAVPGQLDASVLSRTLQVLHDALRDQFGIAKPRILVCGLNPHAGEGGHLGCEEIEWMAPCLDALRAAGMTLAGPLPADTVFTERCLAQGDAVLAMYHDQGLPALKARGFGHSVNITLGLPIVRTSVDHGTALDLAGGGDGDVGSLRAAIDCAERLAARRAAA